MLIYIVLTRAQENDGAFDEDSIRATLQACGILSLQNTCLNQNLAYDVLCEGDALNPETLSTLGTALPAFDINVIPASKPRRKRLFLADMDSTMIEQECIDELASMIGVKAQVSEITERAMRGDIAFEPALRERVGLLKGLPVSAVDTIIKDRLTLTPGGKRAVATMRTHGTYTCLVSGGFTLFTGPIAAALGFHEHRANRLIVRDEHLTGEVEEPILGAQAKLDTLKELRAHLNLTDDETLGIGDGANDLPMLKEASLGVAFRAKPLVVDEADARIEKGDLRTLLYLQGYKIL